MPKIPNSQLHLQASLISLINLYCSILKAYSLPNKPNNGIAHLENPKSIMTLPTRLPSFPPGAKGMLRNGPLTLHSIYNATS